MRFSLHSNHAFQKMLRTHKETEFSTLNLKAWCWNPLYWNRRDVVCHWMMESNHDITSAISTRMNIDIVCDVNHQYNTTKYSSLKINLVVVRKTELDNWVYWYQGRIQGGGAHPARAPLRLEKIWFFWRKIVIFHMKYPKNFACPP